MIWAWKTIQYCNERCHLSIEVRFSVHFVTRSPHNDAEGSRPTRNNLKTFIHGSVHRADITNYSKGNDTSDFMKALYFSCGLMLRGLDPHSKYSRNIEKENIRHATAS